MRKSDISDILHLAHPRPVSWSTVVEPIARELRLPIVPFDIWFASLQKSGDGLSADSEIEVMKRNPALKILDFFRGANEKMNESAESMGLPQLDVSRAEKVAPSLAPDALPQLSKLDAQKWIEYWRSVGAI